MTGMMLEAISAAPPSKKNKKRSIISQRWAPERKRNETKARRPKKTSKYGWVCIS
jgi:hypothetical protein